MGRKASSARAHGNVKSTEKIKLRFTGCTDKTHAESASLATSADNHAAQTLFLAVRQCGRPDCPVPTRPEWQLKLKNIAGPLQHAGLTVTNAHDKKKEEAVRLYNPN